MLGLFKFTSFEFVIIMALILYCVLARYENSENKHKKNIDRSRESGKER